MGLSWHNLFYGAFDPGGTLSIDKPPIDLWLQVLSTKLLGFSSVSVRSRRRSRGRSRCRCSTTSSGAAAGTSRH